MLKIQPTSSSSRRRVAVLALYGECNMGVPPVSVDAIHWLLDVQSADLLPSLMRDDSFALPEMRAFVNAMEAVDVEIVPVRSAVAASGPPFPDAWLEGFYAEVVADLTEAGPLDGVYVANHGAVRSVSRLDAEGALYAHIRDVVGWNVPLVATLDLHGKLSAQMAQMSDLLVAYRTNPHTDMAARGREAAGAVLRMMAGERLYRAWVRVPYLAAMPHLLTTRGPYAKVMIEAERLVAAGLATASVMGGFPYLDTPYNGVCVYAASRSDPREAVAAATRLAGEAWAMREAVRADWLDIAEATLLAVANNDPARPTIVLADIADNPGAGARGNTTGILRSLVNNAARGVVFGPFWDPDLAEAAHRCGVGGHLSANFDRPTTGTFDEPWSVDAAVMGLSDGKIPVRGGVAEGMTLDHGRSAALDLGGISVLVVSKAYQAFSPSQFEAVGLSVEAARTVVLKSRGHFRAAFEPLIPAERIFEVAAPGAISPMIAAFPYRNIQRPIWPLDPKFMWHPEDDVMCATPDHRWTRLAEVA